MFFSSEHIFRQLFRELNAFLCLSIFLYSWEIFCFNFIQCISYTFRFLYQLCYISWFLCLVSSYYSRILWHNGNFFKKIIDVSVPCFFYFNLHLLYSFFSFYWICWWFLCSRCCIRFIKILCLSIYIHVNFLLICPIMFLIVLSILLAFNYISLVFYPTSLTEYLFIVPFYKYVF